MSDIPVILVSAISVILLICAIVILMGKGDGLIAGYNTASKEEKEKAIMPRLRIVIASILVCGIGYMMLMVLYPEQTTIWTVVFVTVVVVGLFFANTWAKKK